MLCFCPNRSYNKTDGIYLFILFLFFHTVALLPSPFWLPGHADKPQNTSYNVAHLGFHYFPEFVYLYRVVYIFTLRGIFWLSCAAHNVSLDWGDELMLVAEHHPDYKDEPVLPEIRCRGNILSAIKDRGLSLRGPWNRRQKLQQKFALGLDVI